MKTIKATKRQSYIHFTELVVNADGSKGMKKGKLEFTGERLSDKIAQKALFKAGKTAVIIDNLETIEQTYEMPTEMFFELATPLVAGEPVEPVEQVETAPVREVPSAN